MGFDKRHSVTVIATAAIARNRLVNYAGAPAVSSGDVRGVSEYGVASGKAVSLITAYSAEVEASAAINVGDYIKPAADGSGRAAVGSGGDCCGRALSAASGAGQLLEVRIRQDGGLVLSAGKEAAIEKSYNAASGVIGGAHQRYFTHLFAGNQLPDDDKVYDISGALGHATRETDLSVSALWTTNAGYFSTLDPTTTPGQKLSRLMLPPLNWDWAGGQSLFIWWLGKATQEAASCSILSNNIGGTTEAGLRVRVATGTGKLVLNTQETNADGAEFYNSSASTLAPFLGTLSSFGIWFDAGARKAYTYVNETVQVGGASVSATMNTLPSAAQIADGYEYRLGGDPLTTGVASSGLATATRALVILKFAATDTLPTAAQVLAVQQALRNAPQCTIAQGAL